MSPVSIVVEGTADLVVARRVIEVCGLTEYRAYPMNGKGKLDQKLAAYNQAAQHSPWLVLRDLDHDAECPSALLARLLPAPSVHMCARIVVREIEAWLMADAERFAAFFGVAVSRVPASPETVEDPKRHLLQLMRESRKRDIRIDMLPREQSGAKEGPAYSSTLQEFAREQWRPQMAAQRSRSLERCLLALRTKFGS